MSLDTCEYFFKVIMPKSNFSLRSPQLHLANSIDEAIQNRKLLIAEAEVGTGKTFAYLFPAIMHYIYQGKKILISTKTIALQEQLINKDIPIMIDLIEKLTHKSNDSIKYFLLKGKNNYICENRLFKNLISVNDRNISVITDEYDNHDVIDRKLFSKALEDNDWDKINASSCNINKCKNHFCKFRKYLRDDFSKYAIIVCNHAYLLSCLKNNKSFVKEYSTIVMDEAHSFEETAYEIYGDKLSLNQCKSVLAQSKLSVVTRYRNLQNLISNFCDMFNRLYKVTTFPKVELTNEFHVKIDDEQIQKLAADICNKLTNLEDKYSTHLSMRYIDSVSDDRTLRALSNLLTFVEQIIDCKKYVWWVSRLNENNIELNNTPINVSSILKRQLFDLNNTFILTSGTMSAHLKENGDDNSYDFDYFEESLGIAYLKQSKIMAPIQIKSDFNYRMNGLIYFEKDIDFVPIEDLKRHQKYLELLSVRIVDIIKSSHGRTLVLFTSKEEMKNTYILVHSEIENLGYTCYMHNGNASKTTADNFITNISSCLFSASYWEGIDVKGPSLSTVIIQKLPYSCPSPSFDYRNKVYQSIGFDNLNKMLMLTKLRQGAGRLIRDAKDRGIVAILDTRARKTELQEDILYNLPPFQIADTVADIKTFFDMDE